MEERKLKLTTYSKRTEHLKSIRTERKLVKKFSLGNQEGMYHSLEVTILTHFLTEYGHKRFLPKTRFLLSKD